MNRARKPVCDDENRGLVADRSCLSTRLLAALVLTLAMPAPVRAQMQLPGATNGVAAGAPPAATGGNGGAAPYVPPKPVILKPPSEDTLLGHALAHDGASGTMTFEKSGADLVLSKLAFTGDKISAPGQRCSIDIALAPPLVVTPDGRPEGALRFAVPVEACPFSVDVLDGAVLVSNAEPSCEFKAADCRVSPVGLWGPTPAEITPQRAKELERKRVQIETTMRTDFRALLKRAGKDRVAVKAIAREQAGFSSDREVTCRDYAQESVHGFCSTQITEARVLSLIAKFGGDGNGPESKRAPRKAKPKPGPKLDAPPAEPSPEAGAR